MQLLGLDEAGRGSWAGPIFVSIVALSGQISGLDDSKNLTPAVREELFEEIRKKASYVGVGAASSKYIDKHGLTKATIFAARRAIKDLDNIKDGKLIIDGNVDYLPEYINKSIVVRADSKYSCVAAASIIAKVLRDRHMVKLSEQYTSYGFEKHMGYGTKLHKQSIDKLGLCSEHRVSFRPMSLMVS